MEIARPQLQRRTLFKGKVHNRQRKRQWLQNSSMALDLQLGDSSVRTPQNKTTTIKLPTHFMAPQPKTERRELTPKERELIVGAHNIGNASLRKISKHLHVPKSTVANTINNAKGRTLNASQPRGS